MIRTDFHAHDPKDVVGAHVTAGTAFISCRRGDTAVTLYIPVEKARAILEALKLGIAEHDLIAKAKADAAEQAEAA
jgi:hypothetical protein